MSNRSGKGNKNALYFLCGTIRPSGSVFDLKGAAFLSVAPFSTSTLRKKYPERRWERWNKAWSGHLFNIKHQRPLGFLDITLDEVLCCPFNVNETRIPSRWKCSRRLSGMQRQGLLMSSYDVPEGHPKFRKGSLSDLLEETGPHPELHPQHLSFAFAGVKVLMHGDRT
jgi:hypothetical protein